MTPESEPSNFGKRYGTPRRELDERQNFFQILTAGWKVNYYLTQLLSGHGYFRKYLFKLGRMTRPNCIYGETSIDDAEHTYFNCES